MAATHLKDTLTKGQHITVKVRGESVPATYLAWNEKYNLAHVQLENGQKTYRKVLGVDGMAIPANKREQVREVKTSRFDVNTRFEFIKKVVGMVVSGESKSVIISGSGGLGKTYTVMRCLDEAGLVNVDEVDEDGEAQDEGLDVPGDFKIVKGFTTPKSLYRLLWNMNGKIVVFDDCDSVWDNPTTVSLLKAALDSYDVRRISWLTELAKRDDDLPSSFIFTGKIIFVSNLGLAELDPPTLSRCLYVDVSMTPEEKVNRIAAILPGIRPDIPMENKQDALELIREHRENIGDLNIRTIIKVLEIQHSNPKDWRELAEYVITAM